VSSFAELIKQVEINNPKMTKGIINTFFIVHPLVNVLKKMLLK